MKTTKIDLNAIPVQAAMQLVEQGKRLAEIAKEAVDKAAIAYWSEYYKGYGDMWVQDGLALQKPKQAKVASQSIYDCGVQVTLDPTIELAPKAFEHALKFCLEALKCEGAASVQVDHIYAEIDDPLGGGQHMVGFAHCGVNMTEDPQGAFAATMKSQLAHSLKEAGFPAVDIAIEGPEKRMAPTESIVFAARRGDSLAKLASQFGLFKSRCAKRCLAKEQNAPDYSALVVERRQAQMAIEKIKEAIDAKEIRYEGQAETDMGIIGTSPHGYVAQINYQSTELPEAFRWEIRSATGEVMKIGKADTEENAKQMIAVELPRVISKDEQEEIKARMAVTAAVKSPVTRMERVARVGSIQEVRVETQAGQTHWVSLDGGKVLQAVCSL
jgi:hypothetical protein